MAVRAFTALPMSPIDLISRAIILLAMGIEKLIWNRSCRELLASGICKKDLRVKANKEIRLHSPKIFPATSSTTAFCET